MNKNRGSKIAKFLQKRTLLFYAFSVFLVLISLVWIFSGKPVFAVSQSANYILNGGQFNSLSGVSASANYGLETGGQPIAGKITGIAYDTRQGSSFSGRTAVAVISCGDGTCNGTETCSTCSADCGVCGGGGGEIPPEVFTNPFITQLNITDITTDQARVTFQTDQSTITYISYGAGFALDLTTPTEASFTIGHDFILSDLIPNTQYSLVAHMRAVAGQTASSVLYTFTTASIVKVVPNVSNLIAVPDDAGPQINLLWENPAMTDFAGIKLLRDYSSYPANPDDGVLLFDGSEQSFLDANIVFDQRYYYTIFVYDTSNNYSSGAIVSAIVLPEEEIIPPEEELPPEEISPEEEPPEEEIPPGEEVPPEDEIIESELPELPAGVIPGVESVDKEIAVFSSIKQDVFAGEEEIVLVFAPNAPITEQITAAFVKELSNTFVALKEFSADPGVQKIARTIIAPVSLGASFFILIPSLASILLPLLRFLFLQPLLFLGLRKRKRYGVVYNSLNKLPIDLAVVRLIDNSAGKIVQTAVTDDKGRYGFYVVKPGIYKMEVAKNDLVFPSKLLSGLKEDGRMLDIYHGEDIFVDNENVNVVVNIPMDPIGAIKTPWRVILQKRVRLLQYLLSMSGIFSTAIVILITNVWYLWIFLALHIVMFFLFLKYVNPRKPKGWGVVYDADNRKPINKVIARLFSKEYNKLIDFRVTDRKGRYAFLVGPSDYYVAFERTGYQDYRTPDLNFKDKETGETFINKNVRLEKTGGENMDDDYSDKKLQANAKQNYQEQLQAYEKTLEEYKEIVDKISDKPIAPPPPPPKPPEIPPSILSWLLIFFAGVLLVGFVSLTPAKAAEESWSIFAGSDSLLSIPADNFDKPVEMITATIDSQSYILVYDEKTKNYEAVIKAPDQSGKYRLTTRIIYTDNTYEQSAKVVLVRPYGYVYTEKYQSWSWQKPWQIFFKEKTRVKGAQVALYVLNQKKEWVLWQADSYKQKNPQASGENGEYVFVVPPGKYFLTVKSEGLIRYESGEFKVSENSVVNSPVAMRALFPWRVLVVSLLIFAVVFYAGKKTFFNKDKV